MKAEVAKVQTFFLSLNFCNLGSIFESSDRKIMITVKYYKASNRINNDNFSPRNGPDFFQRMP